MKEPLVSVIILNYKGLNDLKECFDSLNKIMYQNIEIFLVDNNSQDKSVEIIRRRYNKIKILELKNNYGFAKGNNLAMTHVNGKFVVLLNMDTVVDKDWLTELVKVAQSSNKIGIVGSKIYYYDDKKKIDFAGSYTDIYGNITNIGKKKMGCEIYNNQTKAFYICGASLMFKKEVYNKIGLFDPLYFMYYEDVDFCWRAWIYGYDVIYAPKSIIFHKIGHISKDVKIKYYFTEKNRLRTMLKNYELKSLLKILPRYFFLSIRRIFKWNNFIPQLRRSDVLITFIKVIIWNFIHISSIIRIRREIQVDRTRDDKFLFNLIINLETNYRNK